MGDAADMAMDIEMGFCDDDGIPYDLPEPPKKKRKAKKPRTPERPA